MLVRLGRRHWNCLPARVQRQGLVLFLLQVSLLVLQLWVWVLPVLVPQRAQALRWALVLVPVLRQERGLARLIPLRRWARWLSLML